MIKNAALDTHNRYLLPNYQEKRPFASFLPGIAGPLGIPMWVFYVNRGQAIASFGIENKDHPMMEFQPANKSYVLTPITGFRTFVKLDRQGRVHYHEPFAPWSQSSDVQRQMAIGLNDLQLSETSPGYGLHTTVSYFILPEEKLAGLVRKVTFQNLGTTPLRLQLLDGMPQVIPYGLNNFFLKEMSRTMEAWMEVSNLAGGIPFYHVRASVADTSEVTAIQAGHFALAVLQEGEHSHPLPVLVDPNPVFGFDTSLYQPQGFMQNNWAALWAEPQITTGRTPCAFFGAELILAPGENRSIYAIYGHAPSLEMLTRQAAHLSHAAYLEEKYSQALELGQSLTQPIATHSGLPMFDAYCRQTFLDNVMRGGWPVLLGDEPARIFHIYARKHGDLERDYNAFHLAAEPYSQGNGNYRDINQNRRCDVFFQPRLLDFNIRTFYSFIQADGYNPLVIQGSNFTLPAHKLDPLLRKLDGLDHLKSALQKPFTPGKLLVAYWMDDGASQVDISELWGDIFQDADQHLQASFGEGYWIDHWTYNLDLIESTLAIYPDQEEALLFAEPDYPFYDSPAIVQPRHKKYVLSEGQPRQLGSTQEDQQKEALIAARQDEAHWLRSQNGSGQVYYTNLFGKLVVLALTKFASLDPWGMGIEMEAGKPGWYDALNGLPSLFGSGMAESYELLRLLAFMQSAIPRTTTKTLRLPQEVIRFYDEICRCLADYENSTHPDRDFGYWDGVSSAREAYREEIRLGFEGSESELSLIALDSALARFQNKLQRGIERAVAMNDGLPPTYFRFQVEAYDLLTDAGGHERRDPQGRPYLRPKAFRAEPLPLFLEGFVRAMRAAPGSAQTLHNLVKSSPLYDTKLGMYKVNAPLENLPHEIGRARAFAPGWLENESIWLHMAYKYLLALLKAGLYETFFEEVQNTLVPFLDAETYGRSILENSSFLVSSSHPDAKLHGAGFVARLSGSTAEFLSIWNEMMAGPQPFYLHEGQLQLALRPALPGWLFDDVGKLSFNFLGQCRVTYHNPKRKNTFGQEIQPRSVILHLPGGRRIELPSRVIPAPYAQNVRDGLVEKIDLYFD